MLTATGDVLDDEIRGAAPGGAIHSHAALVVPHDGRLVIVEATPFGSGDVAFGDIADFTTAPDLSDLLVLRPHAPVDTARLSERAGRLVAAHVPFDYDLDDADASRLYCSELVMQLLRDAAVPVESLPHTQVSLPLGADRSVIMPDAFAEDAGFSPVFHRES